MNDAVSALTLPKTRTLADRVRDIGRALGCDAIWVRASGPHVLVGLGAASPRLEVGHSVFRFEAPTRSTSPGRNRGRTCFSSMLWPKLSSTH